MEHRNKQANKHSNKLHSNIVRTHARTCIFFVRSVPLTPLLCHGPRLLAASVKVLREERVLRKVDVGDYPLDLVPLEKDVLSLELDGLFRRVRVYYRVPR